MCKFLMDRDAEEFRAVSRSMRIHGHSTSLRLEACFWRALDELARVQGLTTPKLIEALQAEASAVLDVDDLNLASILRTACLLSERAQRRDAPA